MNARKDLGTDVSIKEMQNVISVKELMTRDIIFVEAQASILEVAMHMTEHNVDSVVVKRENAIAGIITEKDIVSKTTAKNMLPAEVRACEIMSSPIISIRPSTGVIEAAKHMLRSDIRRLAVMDGDAIQGMITYKDIMAISPGLNTILQNLIELHRERELLKVTDVERGICQRCGSMSDYLIEVNGLNLCEDCCEEEGYYD